MCRRVTCKTCGKPGWAGCGAHVEMVLGDVPKADRCRCREPGARAASPARSPAVADDSAMERFKGWLRK